MASTQPQSQPNARKKAASGLTQSTASVRLTRDDWLDAAFRAAINGGLGAVRVLSLANALGVSRGSFYWHFTDHAELVNALIDRWYQRTLVLDKGEQLGDPCDPTAGILRILDNAIAHSVEDREHDRFEQALRGQASKDSAVAAVLESVDRARLQLVYSHYVQLVKDDDTARELAALFYLAVVGSHEALNRPSASVKVSDYLKTIIARHLVHAVAPTRP
jgi:AcrR family transcriptional regulator